MSIRMKLGHDRRSSSDHPPLAEQIDAVEWAEPYVLQIAERAGLTSFQTVDLGRRLAAAAETLRMLEFGREMAT